MKKAGFEDITLQMISMEKTKGTIAARARRALANDDPEIKHDIARCMLHIAHELAGLGIGPESERKEITPQDLEAAFVVLEAEIDPRSRLGKQAAKFESKYESIREENIMLRRHQSSPSDEDSAGEESVAKSPDKKKKKPGPSKKKTSKPETSTPRAPVDTPSVTSSAPSEVYAASKDVEAVNLAAEQAMHEFKTQIVAAAQTKLDDRDAQVAAFKRKLEERDAKINTLHEDLAEREETIVTASSMLKARDARIAELENELEACRVDYTQRRLKDTSDKILASVFPETPDS